jgi:hypothetical protein
MKYTRNNLLIGLLSFSAPLRSLNGDKIEVLLRYSFGG